VAFEHEIMDDVEAGEVALLILFVVQHTGHHLYQLACTIQTVNGF
jgi:hypothetical protein